MNINEFIARSGLGERPNKREKIIFFTAIVLFSFVFIQTCWGPSRNAISVLQAEKEDALSEVSSLQGAARVDAPKASAWSGDLKMLELYNKWAASVISLGADTAVMNEFNSQALLRDVQLKSLSFVDAKREEGVMKRGFKASFYGDFTAIGACLERVNDVPLLMTIDSMVLTNANQMEGQVNLDLEGVVYGWK